jgi:hypothetical protein
MAILNGRTQVQRDSLRFVRRGRLGFGRLARIQVVLLLLWSASGFASGPDIDADQVKAVFLYKVAKFVDWPDGTSGAPPALITICVMGNNTFADLLEGLVKAQPANNQEFGVRRITSVSEIRGCRILYLGASQRRQVHAILGALRETGVLTAGETEGFAIQGCVIDFWMEANRVRFEINTDAAARAHLKISSKLLNLAARVVKE